MDMKEYLILVDENDEQTGIMEKQEVHRKGLLHRAVSVFVFNSKGEWLLQQRAFDKYHSGSLWSNACCTHPFPGESNLDAANRRLIQEMGLSCPLNEVFQFTYKETLANELIENEFDHVFVGISDNHPCINLVEVMGYRYMSTLDLLNDVTNKPEQYTVWFRHMVHRVHEQLNTIH